MNTNCQYIPCQSTGFFSKMVIDYIGQNEKLHPFYNHPASIEGLQKAIEFRKQTTNHRQLLVEVLEEQYADFALTPTQQTNLRNLLLDNTFTITTAHQPNIFTGHLYFIYKILHTVKLASSLTTQMPENNFVPIFYMGSEDADLDELGHINLDGEKLEWQTKQTGGVGRMIVDEDLVKLIAKMEGRLGIYEHSKELFDMIRWAYQPGSSIQHATLRLVNELFKEYGLLIVIPDNARLKSVFNDVLKRELTTQFSHKLVQETSAALSEHYKVQASGREINLFYLVDDHRERIQLIQEKFQVQALKLSSSSAEILEEVDAHPERFSANVILRGVFQETILPNIAFIGGGGEVAYWLELKDVFEACAVPFPVLVLRNSFLLIKPSEQAIIKKLQLSLTDIFKSTFDLTSELVNRESTLQLSLQTEKGEIGELYNRLSVLVNAIDVSLNDHVASLKKRAEKSLVTLEKKMLRAEKRKFQAQQRQIIQLKQRLFPQNNLQERVENFAEYYALYGKAWIQNIYGYSLTLEQQFAVMLIN